MKKNILFVCVENAGRSQMAEAFARIYGYKSVMAYSAGSRPGKSVNPDAITVMKEVGYNLTTHHPKSLDEIPQILYDYVITMGCGDACPLVRASKREEWKIADPKGQPLGQVRAIRDEIAYKVKELLRRIKKNA
jgi:arsenate reductase (thioredoxin)